MATADNNRENWDRYWLGLSDGGFGIYQTIAAFYRKFIIKPSLDRVLDQTFTADDALLHAGCGGGQMDAKAVARFNVTALDISSEAINRYNNLHGNDALLVNGDLFFIPIADGSFDGIFNLGVMEHFTDDELNYTLREFHRVLKKNGQLVLFWPPEYGLSVKVLKLAHFILNDIMGRDYYLHPKEPSLLKSRRDIAARFFHNGFKLDYFSFGFTDLFTHAIVIARRID